MTKSRLQHAVDDFRAQLQAQESAAMSILDNAHQRILKQIAPHLEALYDAMVEKLAGGEKIPASWMYEAGRLEAITKLISHEIGQFASLALMQVSALQHMAVDLGTKAAQAFLHATVPDGVRWSFGLPSLKAISELVGVTQDGSPLADLFNGFGREAAQKAEDALLSGVAMGKNPREIAPDVQDALGVSRNRALTISRQESLRCYKNSNTETYRANDDVVEQWRWTCALNAHTCFPEGTSIQTSRGHLPIEQVKVGDEVLTHKGRYKRVAHTSQRPYSGEMVTVTSGKRSVVATSNHPFLIEREGKLDWIEASNIGLTDHVICQSNSSSQVANHDLGNIAIKRRIGDTNNSVSSVLQECGFASIGLLDSFRTMPINAVDLKSDIAVGQEKINGVPPAFNNMLLYIVNPQCFKAETRASLWSCFSRVLAVTLHRTKLLNTSETWHSPELFTAILASKEHWRSAAFLRAVFAPRHSPKYLSAPLAGMQDILRGFQSIGLNALGRTKFAFYQAGRFEQSFAAFLTGYIDASVSHATLRRTIQPRLFVGRAKLFAASFADQVQRWRGDISRAGVWLKMLPFIPTFIAAKPPIPFALPCLENSKFLAAHFTYQGDFPGSVRKPPSLTAFRTTICSFLPESVADIHPSIFAARGTNAFDIAPVSFDIKSFHSSIVSQHDTHVQSDITVYNLEVEEDHSYVASGFVVHNCAACIAMDGTLHPLSENLESHTCCRCQPVCVTRDWRDILGDAGIDTSVLDLPDTRPTLPTGADWLDNQSVDVQKQVLGNKYKGWKAGDFTLKDIVGHKHDPNWGHSIHVKPLKDLVSKNGR